MAARSICVGQLQSKSASGLKLPDVGRAHAPLEAAPAALGDFPGEPLRARAARSRARPSPRPSGPAARAGAGRRPARAARLGVHQAICAHSSSGSLSGCAACTMPVVRGQRVRAHRRVAPGDVFAQAQRRRRRPALLLARALQRQAHRVGMRHVLRAARSRMAACSAAAP